MSTRSRIKKYSRRTVRRRKPSKGLVFALAAVAFLALCFIVSVCVGLALGNRADEYSETDVRYDFENVEYYSGNKKVVSVKAESYQWGYGAAHLVDSGVTDLSICLRDIDGFITYNSEIEVSFDFDEDFGEGSRDLAEEVDAIHRLGARVCGYIYVRSFKINDEYLREIYKSYEIALINEAAASGVDEILLLGIEPTDENIVEVERYVSKVASSSGDALLGVLLPRQSILAVENNNYTASRVRSVCDFVAIDMTDIPRDADLGGTEGSLYKTIGELEYYIEAYSARLVFSSEARALYDAAANYGVKSLQLVE